MNIIFDLDGTLIDSKPRLYYLFQQLAPRSKLSYEQYWAFKENKTSNETILASELSYTKQDVAVFVKEWMALIESPELLQLDTSFSYTHDTLTRLQQQATLHLCTARQLRETAFEQLARLNLLPFFDQVLVTEQKRTKEDLIKAHVSELCSQDWILGDTGKDVQVGKALAIKTCAVLSGFLNEKSLRAYNPDWIIDSVTDFHPPSIKAVYSAANT